MSDGAIILVMGPPAGGKTTTVQGYVNLGYQRLNRDEIGGTCAKQDSRLHILLRELFQRGERRFVLDNTYANKASREAIIALGVELGLPVHAKWLQTTEAEAQFLAALRQMRKYGRVIGADDCGQVPYKSDPNCFPPMAQYAYWKRMEPPSTDEGFASVEAVPFKLDLGPEYANSAVLFDFDGTLRDTTTGDLYPKHPDEVVVLPRRAEKLQALQAAGVLLLGASNQSGIARSPSHPFYVSEENANLCFRRTLALLGVTMDYEYAAEEAGVPKSFRRKPLPGMAVTFVERYKLCPSKCLMVGDLKSDRTFAERAGFQFAWAKDYFGD
ncbi:MAG: hypothetical protein A2Y38_08120 [Spirochaetes bacterium GWB1_59_5]|nr:MAG: hypothetical protein A2Y38_08120 [Spirochaetes bacterium GWB1_59_5]